MPVVNGRAYHERPLEKAALLRSLYADTVFNIDVVITHYSKGHIVIADRENHRIQFFEIDEKTGTCVYVCMRARACVCVDAYTRGWKEKDFITLQCIGSRELSYRV